MLLMRGFGGGVSKNCSGEERTVLNNYQHPHSLILFIKLFTSFLLRETPFKPLCIKGFKNDLLLFFSYALFISCFQANLLTAFSFVMKEHKCRYFDHFLLQISISIESFQKVQNYLR